NYVRTLASGPALAKEAAPSSQEASPRTEPPEKPVAQTVEKKEPAKPATEVSRAQASKPPSDQYVSREEYEKLRQEFESLKSQVRKSLGTASLQEGSTNQVVSEREKEEGEAKGAAEQSSAAKTAFLLTGYGSANFTARRGTDSFFDATFNPIFL